MSSITINDKQYVLADLSDKAQQELANIQAVDAEVARLQTQAAIFQTARNAYVNALVAEVEGVKTSGKKAGGKK